MSPRRIVFLFIALFASGITMVVGRAWLHAGRAVAVAEAPKPAPKAMPEVLVAKGDIPAGQFVRPENLRWQPWPEGGIAAGYAVKGQRPLEDFIGAVVRSGLSDAEPITEGRVVRPGDRGFLAAVLTPGYRAVTVSVTPSSGLAGFVFPGDRVDLLLTFAVPGPPEHRASETVLTDVRVLAVDQRADDQNKEVVIAKTATLEVTPKQAETIAVVSDLGKLSLSLRSLAHDEAAADTDTRKLSYTWDSDATHLLAPPLTAGTTRKVSVVRGAEVKEMEFSRSVR